MKYIPINKENIPYRFQINIEGKLVELRFKYNATYDFFTVDLYINEQPIVQGEKIVYGKPLFTIGDNIFKNTIIIPYDVLNENKRATYDNLENTVFLYIAERY